MNNELKQLFGMLLLVVGTFCTLWLGVMLTSPDMQIRNSCYQKGVANLPQGIDQTLLQTQSKAYKECLAVKK